MTYCLSDLRACSRLKNRPAFIPVSRPRGVKGRGLTFERKVGKVLRALFPAVRSNVWYEYHDARRSGVCCIDHYVVLADRIILVECKLSEKEQAWTQMADLYAPILERQYDLPVARVQATRHIRTEHKLLDDIRTARPGREYLWHVLV